MSPPFMEDLLIEILNRHGDELTCFNCGVKLGDIGVPVGGGTYSLNNIIAHLCVDSGTPKTGDCPGEPGTIYFECIECAKSGTYLTKIESDVVLRQLQDTIGPKHPHKKVLENAIEKLKGAVWYHGSQSGGE